MLFCGKRLHIEYKRQKILPNKSSFYDINEMEIFQRDKISGEAFQRHFQIYLYRVSWLEYLDNGISIYSVWKHSFFTTFNRLGLSALNYFDNLFIVETDFWRPLDSRGSRSRALCLYKMNTCRCFFPSSFAK